MTETDNLFFLVEKLLLSIYLSFFFSLTTLFSILSILFGSFKVGKRAAREGRNPKTGEKIKIPAMKTAKFKAGKGLKDAVR